MKKNKIVIGVLMLVLIALMPLAIAEDTSTTIDANTLEEVKALNSPLGAEVRLLQLEKSLTKNILVGAKVIEVLKKNHPETDLNQAENTLNSMEALIEEIQNTPRTGDANELAATYVALKSEGRELTKQFREATASTLTEEDKKEVRDALKDLELLNLQTINEEIKQAIRAHNAEKIQELLDKLGITNPELIQKIKNGNASLGEVKKEFNDLYGKMNLEERKLAGAKLREHATKRIIAEKELIKEAREHATKRVLEIRSRETQRLSDWFEKRAQDLNDNGFDARGKRLQKASDQMQKISEKLDQLAKRGRGRN